MKPPPVTSVRIADITVPRERSRTVGDFEPLAESIRAIGLLSPITLTKDLVLVAGLHRLRACKSLLWTEIPAFVLDLAPLAAELAELDENLMRRELTVLERAQMLKRRKELFEALTPEAAPRPGRPKKNRKRISTFSQDTAKKAGVSPRTVRHEVQIADGLTEEVQDAIRGTPLADSKTDLLELARIKDPQKQLDLAKRAAKGETTVRKATREAKREERVARLVAESKTNTPLTGDLGTFPIILADPPWSYDNVPETEERHITEQYSTMSLLEICKLPVDEISTDDAWLFLWATSPLLPEAMRVMSDWGFTYKTSAVWVKGDPATGTKHIGMGYVFRQRHEWLLVGVKGNPPTPHPSARPDSVIEAPRGKHSAKPPQVAELLERMFPELPKIELFAREKREGWIAWGNHEAAA